MAKRGLNAFDSDMHVYDAADLYDKYMKRAKLHGPPADVPLSRKPSDYFLKQCFISMDPDEHLVSDVIKGMGDDNILISMDYPHIDAHFSHALDEFFEIDGLDESSRRKIVWDNCNRLYGADEEDYLSTKGAKGSP